MDDEIEYLGTKPASVNRPANNRPFLGALQPTGITLHIEKYGGEIAETMTFQKPKGNTIAIGRRPPKVDADQSKRDQEEGKAMFRCPVVSRKHAQIMFSDAGNVFLIDLGSHHGTHLRKPDLPVSTMLRSEMPTALSTNDIITFGKSVGRGGDMVRPVVARVELLFNQPVSAFRPLIVPDSPTSSEGSAKSTGRYGVRVSSPESSSGSDHDSDIEELCSPSLVPSNDGGPPQCFDSLLGRASQVLKKLIPPAHSAHLSQIPPITSHVFFSRSPQPPSEFVGSPGLRSPAMNPLDHDDAIPSPPRFDLSYHDLYQPEDHARSASPMELGSPSSVSAPLLQSPLENVLNEPVVVGAWPSPPSQRSLSLLPEPSLDEGIGKVASEAAGDVPPAEVATPSFDINAALDEVKDEVSKLHVLRRKYKLRFNANAHIVKDKLSDLDERVTDVNGLCNSLIEQVDNLCHMDIPDLQAQIDSLQDREQGQEDLLSEREDAQANIQALRDLVADTRTLRETTEQQMAAELEAVRRAREAAINAMSETPSPMSLKRKRDESEVEDVSAPANSAIAIIPVHSRKRVRIASVMVQTTATVALGAVATWAALAFS
ncbi:uncharacterized protein BT62DRAFT_1080852 [Guyanagaster necrorhizus]|uniref:FHA domain-containing protein n=1 Tax=Guyanagaster necrorhizus TaxID=856835 RepID=A0A9P7VH53_9AGAR|nr:uncharacterized protein BT62DRAFT_1080852 [Guyanagaster necrorhizus MCA 3950]KAG7440483.1 hypothetical protein BT62DRAFT_1080852 [Guyanagaster necrorhizus MCA 3950]